MLWVLRGRIYNVHMIEMYSVHTIGMYLPFGHFYYTHFYVEIIIVSNIYWWIGLSFTNWNGRPNVSLICTRRKMKAWSPIQIYFLMVLLYVASMILLLCFIVLKYSLEKSWILNKPTYFSPVFWLSYLSVPPSWIENNNI